MATSTNDPNGDFGFQIAPMIDVIFVLMLFFMAIVAHQTVEKELSVDMSGGIGSAVILPVIVDVNADGGVFVNGTIFSSELSDRSVRRLEKYLTESAAVSPDDPVIIRPQNETRHERVMDILNACSAANVHKITFAGR